eukprot:1393132-Amorphochlora_amoeboformis.AAC.1
MSSPALFAAMSASALIQNWSIDPNTSLARKIVSNMSLGEKIAMLHGLFGFHSFGGFIRSVAGKDPFLGPRTALAGYLSLFNLVP